MEKDIKTYRDIELKNYVFGNILLILVMTGLIHRIILAFEEEYTWKGLSEFFSSTLISATIYIFVFILDSVIPSKVKFKILWPVKGLPGNRIFSEIKRRNCDERFTSQAALAAYADTYRLIESETGKKQRRLIENSVWYKLYLKNESHGQIYSSQRDFLLCRDMAVMTIWISIGYLLVCRYLEIDISIKLVSILITEFFLVWLSARVKGKRFVYSVIARDLAVFKNSTPNK